MSTVNLPSSGDRLVHATYWGNINGISKEGIIPGKMPRARSASTPSVTVAHAQLTKPQRYTYQNVEISTPHLNETKKETLRDSIPEKSRVFLSPSLVEVNGLEQAPDVVVNVSRKKLEDYASKRNSQLEIDEETGTISIDCPIPPDLFDSYTPVQPDDLPQDLQASIADLCDFDSIPILDLGNTSHDELLTQLKRAACDIGFFQVINHGVDTDLMNELFNSAKNLFDCSQAEKDRYLQRDGKMIGYFGKGMENLEDVLEDEKNDGTDAKKQSEQKVDNKEGFDMNGNAHEYKEVGEDSSVVAPRASSSEFNTWLSTNPLPDDLVPGFSNVMRAYQEQVLQLGLRILDLIGEAASLSESNPRRLRQACAAGPVCTHRVLHYPTLKNYRKEVSIGAHVDYGFLTILGTDDVGGLQVLNTKKKCWIHVPPVKNSFVINFGAMLHKWTNGRIKATIHRVVNLSQRERYSSPFFLRPPLSTVLDPRVFDPTLENVEVSTCKEVLESYYKRTNLLK